MNTLEQETYISFLNQQENRLLEGICGKKYARMDRKFWRAKTVLRTICTRFGEITIKITPRKECSGRIFFSIAAIFGNWKVQAHPRGYRK